MTIQDLGALGELIGSVAVLATLIYLTLQTRQNTAAIRAQLDVALVGANQNSQLLAATSNNLMEELQEDSTVALTRLGLYWTSVLGTFDWQLCQARRGLLPGFDERGVRTTLRYFFRNFRSFEGWWEGFNGSYSPEFVEWVEEQRAKAA